MDKQIIKQYQDIIDQTNIVSKTDANGIITYVNDKFCKVSWYSRDELIWKSHNIIRHPDMPEEVFKDLWNTIKSQKTWEGILKNKKKDGWYYWIKTTISPIFDSDGSLIEYISIRSDITHLKDTIKLNNDYKSILEQSNLLVILDKYGIIKYINEKFLNVSTYKYNELIGKKYIDFIPKSIWISVDKMYREVVGIIDMKEKEIDEITQALGKNQPWRGVIKNKWKLWNIFWTSTIILPILDFDGNIKEFYLVQTDITDLEIAKNQLKKSFKELKDLDQRKNDFLNIASHELRTPMTSIKWYLSMMMDGDIGKIDDEANVYLGKVYAMVEGLLSLINDMLDISKMESGKIEFYNQSFDIVLLLKETITDLNIIAKIKCIDISFSQQSSFMYVSDKIRMKQIFTNIIGNAIKFTPENGKIEVIIEKKNEDIQIKVKDNGIWISQEDRKKIFHKFWQVKNSLTRDIWWTGLGLSIVKGLLKKMWWKIDFTSQVWVGTEFIIILPLKK